MYPAGALLVAQALQEERLREAASRRRDPDRRNRPERRDPWGAILRIPSFRWADAKG